jgi:hypothetical protein
MVIGGMPGISQRTRLSGANGHLLLAQGGGPKTYRAVQAANTRAVPELAVSRSEAWSEPSRCTAADAAFWSWCLHCGREGSGDGKPPQPEGRAGSCREPGQVRPRPAER